MSYPELEYLDREDRAAARSAREILAVQDELDPTKTCAEDLEFIRHRIIHGLPKTPEGWRW